MSGSNQRPTDYKSVALPAELKWLVIAITQFAYLLIQKIGLTDFHLLLSLFPPINLKELTLMQDGPTERLPERIHFGRDSSGRAKVKEFDN